MCPQTPGTRGHPLARGTSKEELKNHLPKENGTIVGEIEWTVGGTGWVGSGASIGAEGGTRLIEDKCSRTQGQVWFLGNWMRRNDDSMRLSLWSSCPCDKGLHESAGEADPEGG